MDLGRRKMKKKKNHKKNLKEVGKNYLTEGEHLRKRGCQLADEA